MKILYIDSGNVIDNSYIYRYYGDLYRELEKICDITVYQKPIKNINPVAVSEKFDCVIFGLGYFARGDINTFAKIPGLEHVKIPTVCLIHKPQHLLTEKLQFCKINNIDLLVDSQSTFKKHGEISCCESLRIWFSASPEYFYPRDVVKKYDIGFIGAMHGNNKINGPTANLRDRIYNLIIDSNHDIYWNGQLSPSDRIASIEEYASVINKSKIWISTTGPTIDVSPRYFEVLLSKTLLFCNNEPEQYGEVFKDGINCIMYQNDLSNFEEKLKYYLQNEKERKKIIETAYEEAISKYTTKHMAIKLLNKIKEIKNVI